MPSDQLSGVTRLRAVEVEPLVPKTAPPKNENTGAAPVIEAPPPPPVVQAHPRDEAMLAAFKALGFAVSARFLLFVAIAGGFVLALIAAFAPTPWRLGVLGVYYVLCVIPMVVLEFVRRQS